MKVQIRRSFAAEVKEAGSVPCIMIAGIRFLFRDIIKA
jgi:hypothetical protein